MNKTIALLLTLSIILSTLLLAGCQPSELIDSEKRPERTVIELDENNYWKYFNVSCDTDSVRAGEKGSLLCEIKGILTFALYEDVVFSFDVIYYVDNQTDDEYQSYTMRIGCNAAGNAKFETFYNGITNATIGKWLGIDGELVNFENYNRKINIRSVTGKVIYTQ